MDAPPGPVVLTRRSCLQGLALLAVQTWAAGGARAAAPPPDGLPADAIVIDAGLPDASNLARGARGHARLEMLSDDVAELFYDRLVPMWRERGVRALAGLTRAPALFLLEPLAAEYGLRTVALVRTPAAGCESVAALCHPAVPRRTPVSAEPIRMALLGGDAAAFAWLMAPVRPPLREGITVIAT
jgi:hypothetical protein